MSVRTKRVYEPPSGTGWMTRSLPPWLPGLRSAGSAAQKRSGNWRMMPPLSMWDIARISVCTWS